MTDLTESKLQSLDDKIVRLMSSDIYRSKIETFAKEGQTRFPVEIDKLRKEDEELAKYLIQYPLKLLPIFERCLNDIIKETKGEKIQAKEETILGKKETPYRVTLQGQLGRNLVSPRGLTSQLTNQYVGVQGIVTRVSIVRPKLVYSTHYCEETRQGSVKEYTDQMTITSSSDANNMQMNANFAGKTVGYLSNTIPTKDINNNPLTFEYGFSKFKDHQVILIQEPPERTPVGQLPRSIEVIVEEDLVDKVKPGDRVEAHGVFKCISSQATSYSGIVRTVLIATDIAKMNEEIDKPEISGEDIKDIDKLSKKPDLLKTIAESLCPGIYGHEKIKQALVLQLLGGVEKNLENGTHLRGDINVLLIGDPSTAKSQMMRTILNIAPNSINTTGRGSSGVGLTAAVVVDPDTGDRHLEAGAMVLGDRGVVCIDEFDKMSELDRVAIHEVMEQQTVTIAKAGIHVSLNARCAVLAAANPIYGQYITDIPAARNIGFPDSLLSRFDLVFVVLDEHDSGKDKMIAERVLNNHMFTVTSPTMVSNDASTVINPELKSKEKQKTPMTEKYNKHLHGGDRKKQILTREFLRKYLYYAKKKGEPQLDDNAVKKISEYWTNLRERSEADGGMADTKIVPVTVRTLETLIRLATAHAKLRLSSKVEEVDCKAALDLLVNSLYNESEEEQNEDGNKMDIDDQQEEEIPKKKGRGRKKKEEEEEDQGEIEIEKPNKKKKKAKKKEEESEDEMNADEHLDDLIDGSAREDSKNFVYKIIYSLAKKADDQTITMDDLYDKILKNPESKSVHKLEKREQVVNIVVKLEEEEKVFLSENQEITLI
ncbi:MAG: ATP-binding protein [archaeon]|nr:ATP-binding protein [archaeon]